MDRPRVPRRVQQPTRVTSWPQIPAARLEAQAAQHVNRITLWLRTRPNLYDSSAAGGASNLFVPLDGKWFSSLVHLYADPGTASRGVALVSSS
eukprot:COSAG02_NODE_2_length_75708_cov_87.013953_24_plen_93_part_00